MGAALVSTNVNHSITTPHQNLLHPGVNTNTHPRGDKQIQNPPGSTASEMSMVGPRATGRQALADFKDKRHLWSPAQGSHSNECPR